MTSAPGGSRDPDHAILRHAARVACVGLTTFVGLGWVLGIPEAAGPSIFAVFTLGGQADFTGVPRRRAARYLSTGFVGLCMFPLGALVSDRSVALVALTGVVVFVTLFLGTLGGPFYAARFPVVIAFLFAVTTTSTGDVLAQRMLGWAVGTLAITAGALLLWPSRARSRVPALTADVCRRAARVLAGGATAGERAGLLDASHQLRIAANREHLHPGAWAADERTWSEVVHSTERLAAACALLAPAAASPADGPLLTAAADTLRAAVDGLARDPSGLVTATPLAPALQDALDDHAARLEASVAAVDAPVGAERAVGDGMASTDVRIAVRIAVVVVALIDEVRGTIATDDAVLAEADEVDDRPDVALRAQLRLRSLWFRNALRAAVALMVAVALVEHGTGGAHGFWVALGAFSVLRADLGTIGRSARSVIVGTAIGFVVSSLVVVASEDVHAILWVTFPVALFLAIYGDRFRSEVGASAYTVMLVTMYTLTEPAGLRTGEVRLLNVTFGAGITLAVGLLLWPRPGRAPGRVVASLVERARIVLHAAITREPAEEPLALITELDRILDVVSTSAPRAFTDQTRARILLAVDTTVTLAQFLDHPRPTAPVPLVVAARSPALRDALVTDGACVDGALRTMVARLASRSSPEPQPPPRALAALVTETLGRPTAPDPAVAAAGIRLAAALTRVHALASAPLRGTRPPAPALPSRAQPPATTGTFE